MKRFTKITLSAMILAGAATALAAPADARVVVGLGIGGPAYVPAPAYPVCNPYSPVYNPYYCNGYYGPSYVGAPIIGLGFGGGFHGGGFRGGFHGGRR